jgi:hypothetical protein
VKIQALSKNSFDKRMKDLGIDDSNVKNRKNLYLISINYSEFPDWMPEEAYPHFKEDHSNVIRLFYDDVLKDTPIQIIATKEWVVAKAFTPEQAKQLVEFLSKIEKKDDTLILVHCKAGKSRSVATAHFISEFFGEDPNLIYTSEEMNPNATVYNLLKEASDGFIKCPRCSSVFYLCNPGNCWCENIPFKSKDVLSKIKEHYDTCLCPKCLGEIKTVDDILN